MNELKIHVERAVRPICATSRTKLRMRNELYAHILDIYQEEFSQAKDERQVLEATKSRFGSPDVLTNELQQTVSWLERREGMLDQWILQRDAESELQHARRLTMSYLLLCPSIVLLACGTWWCQSLLGHTEKGFAEMVHDMWHVGIPLLVFFSIQIFTFALTSSCMYRQIEQSLWPKSPVVAISLSVFSGVFVFATVLALLIILTGSYEESLSLLFPRWVILAALMPVGVIGVALAVRNESVAAEPWTTLEIGYRK